MLVAGLIISISLLPMTKNTTRERHHVPWPTLGWLLRRPVSWLAFGFGVGLIRPGSGTWGTVLAFGLWWPMQRWIPEPWLGALVLLASVLGVWICANAGRALGVADHVGIVWDEMVSMWLLLWLLPDNIWVAITAFVLFRVFDTTKPAPIGWLDERFKGGWGVMLDDWVAALYAGVLISIGWYWILPIWRGEV